LDKAALLEGHNAPVPGVVSLREAVVLFAQLLGLSVIHKHPLHLKLPLHVCKLLLGQATVFEDLFQVVPMTATWIHKLLDESLSYEHRAHELAVISDVCCFAARWWWCF
jgi:hypothetical protein